MRPVTATYRLQFNDGFTFAQAEELLPYLAALGVSHLYASPIFAARAGSKHGYDVVDPTRINPELGGEAGFRSLAVAAQRLGLGIILDIVPNHMATDGGNPAWMETLWLGERAPAARLFDIDWSRGPVMLPVLGNTLPDVLAGKEIRLEPDRASGLIVARYFDSAFPLRPGSVAALLAETGLGGKLAALDGNPDGASMEAAREEVRTLDIADHRAVKAALASADVEAVLADQHWRLAHWQAAATEMSYRRFFNITELIGVRVEDPVVFEQIHRLPLALLEEGLVGGLRVDHVDGLADPEAYCIQLRSHVGPGALLVVEKILEGDETLRQSWPVDGTTGYERLNQINRLFVDPSGAAMLDAHLVGRGFLAPDRAVRLAAAKRQVLEETFTSEIDALVALAGTLASKAVEQPVLRSAIMALTVHCPVYRSYITERGHAPEDEAIWRSTLDAVSAQESAATIAMATEIVGWMLDGRAPRLAVRLQQLTGPAMAKGLEDTEFYRSVGLMSANEVGGDLAAPSIDIAEFHALAAEARHRRDLVPLVTHDTKRSIDVRARIDCLASDPAATIDRVAHWSRAVRPIRDRIGGPGPDGLDEWLVFQTLAGAWPISADRIEDYMRKAMREAKRHTRWEAPDPVYEDATIAFARALVDDVAAADFRADLIRFLATIETSARLVSIGQTILQLTVPGIADIYQGTEFWDHSLVDPDNRRPVDWGERALAITGMALPRIERDGLGLTKFMLTRRLLALRRSIPDLFVSGDYRPIRFQGPERFIAFERRVSGAALLVAIPTRPHLIAGTVAIPVDSSAGWRNVMDDGAFESSVTGTTLERDWPFLVAIRRSPG